MTQQRPVEQRPAEQTVDVSPGAVIDDVDIVSIDDAADLAVAIRNAGGQPTGGSGDSGASGAFESLPGLAGFGDPGAGYCVDGVCVMPGDGE